MTITPEKLQVFLQVAQRAPATLAEQIICQEVADTLVELFGAKPEGTPANGKENAPIPE